MTSINPSNPASASDRNVRRILLLLGSGIAALTATAAPALAQEPAGTEESTAKSGEIIVRAQRRDEALGDIPMTVNVLTQETLSSVGVNSVRDLANVTTGYQLAQGGSVPQPAIRGVTTLINGSYENNVAIFIDGLYQASPAAMNIDLPNISNVQVLKGPQGTLYGRNATGGAILVETISPSDTWQGKAELTYGKFHDVRASGYLAGPLSDSLGVMVSGYSRRTDGYFKKASRTTPGETVGRTFRLEQDSLRAKLRLDNSGAFRATASFAFTHTSDPRGVTFSPLENIPPAVGLPGGSTRPMKLGVVASDISSDVEVRQFEGGLTLEVDTGLGEIRSITGYTRTYTGTDFDFDGTYIPFSWATQESRESVFQQSLDYVITAVDRLDLVVGANYYNIKYGYSEPNVSYNGPAALGRTYDPTVETPLSQYVIGSDRDFDRTKEAWAVFLDATFHATDALSVTLGGRYSEEQQDVAAIAWGTGGQSAAVPVLLHPLAERKSSYSKFTPRASVLYKITPDLSIYASYTQGFRSGEWNASIPGNNPAAWFDVNQESIDAFEVGLKGNGSGFNFDLSGFYYDYSNLQVSTTVVLPPPINSTFVLLQNAPKAEIYGAEANLQYEIAENLNIRAGATWLHARYGDNFIFNGVGVNPATPGINANADPLKVYRNVSQDQDLSGLQMSRAPNFSGYFGADYLIPNEDGGLRLSANAKYTDSYVVTNPSVWGPLVAPEFQRKQRFREGSYVLVNASITWTEPAGNGYIRIWGNNLTDHRYRLHYTGTSSFGSYSPMAEPLTFGGTVGYKFR